MRGTLGFVPSKKRASWIGPRMWLFVSIGAPLACYPINSSQSGSTDSPLGVVELAYRLFRTVSSRHHYLGRRQLHHSERRSRERLLRPHVVDGSGPLDANKLAVVLEGTDNTGVFAYTLVTETLLTLVVVGQELLIRVRRVFGHVLKVAEPTQAISVDWTLRITLDVDFNLYHQSGIDWFIQNQR